MNLVLYKIARITNSAAVKIGSKTSFHLKTVKNRRMKRENFKMAVTWLETKRVKVISEEAIISI